MSSMTAMMERAPARTGPARRLFGGRWLEGALLAGMAGVFLVNAVVAALQPSDFTGLVGRSLFGRWFPAVASDWTAWAIGINDGLLGLCLVVAIWSRRLRAHILAWAGVWLLAVTIIKLTALKAPGG
jgi:hypothetical protein